MKRLVKISREQTFLTTDKLPILLCAFKKLKEHIIYKHTTHCTIKHLNNFIEPNHRHVKGHFTKSTGFQGLHYPSRTLKEIETFHAIYKRKRSLQPNCVFIYNELFQSPKIA